MFLKDLSRESWQTLLQQIDDMDASLLMRSYHAYLNAKMEPEIRTLRNRKSAPDELRAAQGAADAFECAKMVFERIREHAVKKLKRAPEENPQ